MTRENEELASISDQAAHWSVVFRDSEPSLSEKREFAEWIAVAPEHVEASLRVARVRAALARPNVRWPETPVEQLVREANATPGENVFPLHPRAFASPEPKSRRTVRVAVGLAASLVVAACLGWFAITRPEQFQTRVGEQRSVLLADGSRVTLNTASKIEVRLRRDRRVIQLVQGEALFEVAHDAARPFDVHVSGVVVRAVGTQFDIDRRATRTVVTVVEGRVAMVVAGTGAKPLPLLFEGDRVVIGGTGPGQPQHGVNLSEVTAWTQRQLVFQRRPLGEIAEEFNRYNAGKVEIRSQALRDQEVTGTFRSDDVASFVTLLAGIPGVHVTGSEGSGYVVTVDESATPGRAP
jgi:transmembrane sensor